MKPDLRNFKYIPLFAVFCLIYQLFSQEATIAQSNKPSSICSFVKGNIARAIAPWSMNDTAPQNTDYYWAAFGKTIDGQCQKRLIDSGGITIYGLGGKYDWGKLYLISVNGNYGKAFNALTKEDAFVNLAPVLIEEVVDDKIYNNYGLKYVDSTKQTIKAVVEFWKADLQNKPLLAKFADSVFNADGRWSVVATRDQLMRLAEFDIVRNIMPYPQRYRTNSVARGQTMVNALQQGHIDTTRIFPPTPAWNLDSIYTGDSVWIGVYGGMDSSKNDFRESLGGGNSKARKAIIPNYTTDWLDTGLNSHDTHCAGIAAGNGWMSDQDSTHGWRYMLRGVAPKASLATIYNTFAGDVNSNSYTQEDGSVYYSSDIWLDSATCSHDTTTNAMKNNIVVFSAGNDGGAFNYNGGSQIGFYTIGVAAKNIIKVGAVQKQTSNKAYESSIGPTRDGRLGPDVMTPGWGSTEDKFHIEIDSMRIRNRVVKKAWNFNNSMDSMVAVNQDSVRTTATALFLYGYSCVSISTDTLRPNMVIDTSDTFVIRFRADDSLAPSFVWCKGQKRFFDIWLRWQYRNDTTGTNPWTWQWQSDPPVRLFGMLNNGWYTLKMPIKLCYGGRAWPADTIKRFAVLFTKNDIMSVNAAGHTGAYQYFDDGGTSMACPHATGVLALMLQKYHDIYKKDIHNRPFWNSTGKALLIHTASDLLDTLGLVAGVNPDFQASGHPQSTIYTKGPDWATGYGLVNAQKAVQYVDTAFFKEDTVKQGEYKYYAIDVPANTNNLRVTLAWDDPPMLGQNVNGNCYDNKLVNDLDLYLVPPTADTVARPWIMDHSWMNNHTWPSNGLDPLITPDGIKSHPAYKGVDIVNNVEVVDLNSPAAGRWLIAVDGKDIATKQSLGMGYGVINQDFSLVYDIHSVRDTSYSTGGSDGSRIEFLRSTTHKGMRTTQNGNIQLSGRQQTGSLSGLKFNNVASIDDNGNLIRTALYTNQGSWLDNASNLTNGFVLKDNTGRAEMHIATDGTVRIRKKVLTGFGSL